VAEGLLVQQRGYVDPDGPNLQQTPLLLVAWLVLAEERVGEIGEARLSEYEVADPTVREASLLGKRQILPDLLIE